MANPSAAERAARIDVLEAQTSPAQPGASDTIQVEANITQALAAAAADIAGVAIQYTFRGTPVKVEVETTAQIGLGTGAAGADNTLGLYITDETNAVLRPWLWRDRLPTSGALLLPATFSKIVNYPAGTVKTFKLRGRGVTISANAAHSVQSGAGNAEGLLPLTVIRISPA